MENELHHHGIRGQRWGVRRYQNEDGSLTNEGVKRYRNKKVLGNVAGAAAAGAIIGTAAGGPIIGALSAAEAAAASFVLDQILIKKKNMTLFDIEKATAKSTKIKVENFIKNNKSKAKDIADKGKTKIKNTASEIMSDAEKKINKDIIPR